MSKIILLEKNFVSIHLTKNEPTTFLKTFDDLQKEKEQRIEEYFVVNKKKSLTKEQAETITSIFDWRIDMMQPGNSCFTCLAFEPIDEGDALQAGGQVIGRDDVKNEDIVQKYYGNYEGIVKKVKNVTKTSTLPNDAKYQFYFIVI